MFFSDTKSSLIENDILLVLQKWKIKIKIWHIYMNGLAKNGHVTCFYSFKFQRWRMSKGCFENMKKHLSHNIFENKKPMRTKVKILRKSWQENMVPKIFVRFPLLGVFFFGPQRTGHWKENSKWPLENGGYEKSFDRLKRSSFKKTFFFLNSSYT
jgi:hypothetical protein